MITLQFGLQSSGEKDKQRTTNPEKHVLVIIKMNHFIHSNEWQNVLISCHVLNPFYKVSKAKLNNPQTLLKYPVTNFPELWEELTQITLNNFKKLQFRFRCWLMKRKLLVLIWLSIFIWLAVPYPKIFNVLSVRTITSKYSHFRIWHWCIFAQTIKLFNNNQITLKLIWY